MKLEEQVTSLELSKRLKALGVKQESLWYWIDPTGYKLQGIAHSIAREGNYDCYPKWELLDNMLVEAYSAFTVAELGEILPHRIKSWKSLTLNHDYQYCCLYDDFNSQVRKEKYSDTEANVRALMLIYLIDNKFIRL